MLRKFASDDGERLRADRRQRARYARRRLQDFAAAQRGRPSSSPPATSSDEEMVSLDPDLDRRGEARASCIEVLEDPEHVAPGDRRGDRRVTAATSASTAHLPPPFQQNAQRRAAAAPVQPTSSTSSTSPRTSSSSRTSTTWSTTSSTRCTATASWEARAPACSWPRRSCARRGETSELLRDIKVPKTWYVSLRRAARLHQLQRPRGGVLPQVHGHRADPAGVPAHRPAVQELPVPAGDLQRAGRWPSTTSATARSSCAARACSRTASGSASPASTRACSWPTRARKQERLEALLDAIAEVYASVFGPDPIEYRAERGLLDFHEEMGILIQEVVGQRVGQVLPARLRRRGLQPQRVPLVAAHQARGRPGAPGSRPRHPGRGPAWATTIRSCSRPASPDLRVNVTPDEIVRYSPRWIDVINLETNTFETVELETLLRECGDEYPGDPPDRLHRRGGPDPQADRASSPTSRQDELVVTFEGLISDTPFVKQMEAMLELLREKLGRPGGHRVRLTTAAISTCSSAAPRATPRSSPRRRSRGTCRGTSCSSPRTAASPTAVSPTSPTSSTSIRSATPNWTDLRDLRDVGKAVGRLNKLLPKRQFVLMGPGPLGQPRRHQARRQRDLRRHQQHRGADRDRPQEGQLRSRALLRHPLLPGPGREPTSATSRSIPTSEGVLDETFLRRAPNLLPDMLPEFARPRPTWCA